MFKDLKVGDTLYLFDKSAITLSTEKVVSVSAPRIDTNAAVGMVVDVTVSNKIYTMRDSDEVCFPGTLVISPDKSVILRAVEAQKSNNEALIAREESIKAEQPKLDEIIEQLSPERKERKQQEERMNRMDKSIGALNEAVGTLKDMVELMLKKNGSK